MACNHICHVCGALENGSYITEAEEEFKLNQTCQSCNFWFCKVHNYGTGFDKHFVVAGRMYLARDSKPINEGGPLMRGFGGAKARVLFIDGTVIVTTNMWYQGEVPEQWRSVFPDNAKFFKEENDMTWFE